MMSRLTKTVPLQYAVLRQDWKPHDYQKKAIKFLLEHAGAGLFLDPGLGKTAIVLGALKVIFKKLGRCRTLVIAPLRVCYSVWPEEVEKWRDFNGFKVAVLHGAKKEQALTEDADIYVINPEGLPWLLKTNKLKQLGITNLVVDESTNFKNWTGVRYKLLKPYLRSFKRRWILTGTPAPNGLMDLFGQIYIIDLGAALGQYITHYRMQHFLPTGFGGYEWKLKPGHDETIYECLRPITLRLAAEDYLELPQEIVTPIWVDLPPKARQLYDAMEEDFFAELDRGSFSMAGNSGAAQKKCEQIANGGLYVDHDVDLEEIGRKLEKREWTEVHDEKTKATLEIMESLNGGQAVVAYEFRHDLERLQKALKPYGGVPPHFGGGGVKSSQLNEVLRRWNDQSLPIILGHPASMSHGLNMQTGGNHVIWHSPTWNLEYWDQFNKRILRQGSIHKHVFIYPILARDTVDKVKWFSIKNKDKTQSALLSALKTYRKERG